MILCLFMHTWFVFPFYVSLFENVIVILSIGFYPLNSMSLLYIHILK